MICFRDMCFCRSGCVNSACPRHFGEDDRKAADIWWDEEAKKATGMNAPIAWADFSAYCEDYKPAEGE